MINADEVAFALRMLSSLPAWYRDNEPTEVTQMRKKLYQQLFTNHDYHSKADFANDNKDVFDETWPRGQAVLEIIKKYNTQNICPHIFELGPSNFWMAKGLLMRGAKFTINGIDFDKAHIEEAKKILPWSEQQRTPTIFVAFELIEHLNNTDELRHYLEQLEVTPEYVCLSTPLYCYGGGRNNWVNNNLGHLRTWTPKEFTLEAQDLFPGYEFKIMKSDCMVLTGDKIK